MSGTLNGYVVNFLKKSSISNLIINDSWYTQAITFGDLNSRIGVLLPFTNLDNGILRTAKVKIGRTGNVEDKIAISLWSFGAQGTPISNSPTKIVETVVTPLSGITLPFYDGSLSSVTETVIDFGEIPIFKNIQYGILIQRTGTASIPAYVFLGGGEFTVDSCDTTTGWIATRGPDVVLDGAEKVEGSYSLDLGWDLSSENSAYYTKTITSFDGTDKNFYCWVYITALDKLDSARAIRVVLGTNSVNPISGNYYYKDFTVSELSVGWNKLGGLITGFSSKNSPNIKNLNIFRIILYVPITSITSGNLKMDYWHLLDSYTLDDCESTSGWVVSVGGRGLSLYPIKVEGTWGIGTGKSLGFTEWYLTKSIRAMDGTDWDFFYVWVYIADSFTLSKLDYITLGIGTDNQSNIYKTTIQATSLQIGWNKIGGSFSSFTTAGFPDLTRLNLLYLYFNTGVNTTQIVNSKILMDYFHIISTADISIAVTSCESAVAWTTSVDAITPTTSTTRKEGSYSLNLGKSGVTSTSFYYQMAVTSFDATSKSFYVWVYINDINDLAAAGTACQLLTASDSGVANAYYKNYTKAELSNGWNLLGGAIPADFLSVGVPNMAALSTLRLTFYTTNIADTVALGDLKMDYYHLSFAPSTTTIDSCDSIVGWNTLDAATNPVLDATKKEGTHSIALGKLTTNALPYAGYEKTVAAFNGDNENAYVWIYITDTTELREVQALRIDFQSSVGNYYYKYFNRADLSNGWNLLGGILPGDFSSVGVPVVITLNVIRVYLYTTNNEIALGNVKLDYLHIGGSGNYWKRSINNTWSVFANIPAYLKVYTSTVPVVENVKVTVESKNDLTNSDGFFEISDLFADGYNQIFFEKSSFSTKYESATIYNGRVSRLDVALGFTPPTPPSPLPPPGPPLLDFIYFGTIKKVQVSGGYPPYTFSFAKNQTGGNFYILSEDTIEYVSGFTQGTDIITVEDARSQLITVKFKVINPYSGS